MKLSTFTILICISLLLYSESEAEIFKCIKANGTIKYQKQECENSEMSSTIEIKSHKPDKITLDDIIQENRKFNQSKSKPEIKQTKQELDKQKKKSKSNKCKQLRSKLKQQEKILYQRCKKGLNTFCDKSPLVIDSSLNRFYSTNNHGYDTNKYVHFKMNGQLYKSPETPILKIISNLQANNCKFNMPK